MLEYSKINQQKIKSKKKFKFDEDKLKELELEQDLLFKKSREKSILQDEEEGFLKLQAINENKKANQEEECEIQEKQIEDIVEDEKELDKENIVEKKLETIHNLELKPHKSIFASNQDEEDYENI